MMDLDTANIGVVGLGYVGLPLAVTFARRYRTVGFDIDMRRIDELRRGTDSTREVPAAELTGAQMLHYTSNPDDLLPCNIIIVTVPTPIDDHRRPDLGPLIGASTTVGRQLRPGNVVVYESTVYPGATEEVCVPILERESGLTLNRDFFVGYSPERINPGDREHRLETICKVTSGSTPEAAELVDALYRSVVTAGTHRASSIRVAEAAKVIENTQRDVNIALINELALIFRRMDIDTHEVLAAAATKWNFLPFRPGLVGGHCIGVDPYYLTHKAQALGYHPEMILAGRRINDGMGAYVAERVIKLMTRRRLQVADAPILVLGLTFKENCPDLRNTRVIDIVEEFRTYNAQVDVHDPWADPEHARTTYGIELQSELRRGRYHAIILAVAHRQFAELGGEGIRALGREGCVVYDVKGVLPPEAVDERL